MMSMTLIGPGLVTNLGFLGAFPFSSYVEARDVQTYRHTVPANFRIHLPYGGRGIITDRKNDVQS